MRVLASSSYRDIERQSEEGTFFNESRPLLGENQHATLPLSKDERLWIRWPVTFLRNFVAIPIVLVMSPLRRYDEAHPGRLPAVFAVIGVVAVCGVYLTMIADVPGAK